MQQRIGWRVFLFLAAGVAACSTSIIWIRLSPTPPALLSGYRLLLSVVFLFPWFFKAWQKAPPADRRESVCVSALPGLALAAHFVTWAHGARIADVANASLIVNMIPLAMPFLLWVTQKERVLRMEWIGTGVAMAGVLLLFAPGVRPVDGKGWGEAICFVSMLLFAFYLALGRKNRTVPNFFLYIVPVYAWAGFFSMGLAVLTGEGIHFPDAQAWGWLAALAIVPTILGHGFNFSLRFLGGQVVSIANQGQFIFAAIMAYFLFAEIPPALFYPAAALVVAGCWITTKSR